MSRSKVAPLSKTPALRKSEKAAAKPAVKTGAKTALKAKLPAPALTTSRKALLVDGSDHAFRQLVHTLLAFLARHETVREGHAAAIGLAGIEYTVLISVKYLAAEGDVSVRELAAHLHLSGAFVTTVSNKLQQMGLLDKLVDPADRRRLRLTVTQAGDALLASLNPTQRQVNDVQFDCLNADEFHQLLGSVERLVESSERAIALQRYLQPRGPDNPAPSDGGDKPARRKKI
ncbi:MarR family transcriptional regulator [Tardiphaga sp. 37S4]|uniref:MarR family winged helix-turn-helix transcriptional regulator n=1 Tax=Tardiphaga sp. 37S4 TaxID=1404741 RepID=UPI001E43DCAC|nr:MarR family transcriptional regulator [Tardiphaga sp. 37S4]UFS73869.1 MarR family transcriptional regulator [Tardiphaga sp. 37S4]